MFRVVVNSNFIGEVLRVSQAYELLKQYVEANKHTTRRFMVVVDDTSRMRVVKTCFVGAMTFDALCEDAQAFGMLLAICGWNGYGAKVA